MAFNLYLSLATPLPVEPGAALENDMNKPTKIERLCPEITDLAREIGDEVTYYGGDYYLRYAHASLWNTRALGALTPERARKAADSLRRMVRSLAGVLSRPLNERAVEVVDLLRNVRWNPGYSTTVNANALDRGGFSRAFGTYDLSVTIGRHRVSVSNIADRGAAFAALEEKIKAAFPAEVSP